MRMRRCEEEKMFYRPPLLEEPCAQTLSGMSAAAHSPRASERTAGILCSGEDNTPL